METIQGRNEEDNVSLISFLSSQFNKMKHLSSSLMLHYGIDLVVELPFIYATQSADVFAEGAIKILNALKCDKVVLVFKSNK